MKALQVLVNSRKGGAPGRISDSSSNVQFEIPGSRDIDPKFVERVSTHMLFGHKSKDVLLSKIPGNLRG